MNHQKNEKVLALEKKEFYTEGAEGTEFTERIGHDSCA
jgi:hypothetical protein